jgi:flagellar operon protein
MSGTFLYPNVTSLPTGPAQGAGAAGTEGKVGNKKPEGTSSDFDQVLSSSLDQIKAPLKFSNHASQRLKDRNIQMDAAMMTKVNDAIDKADAKGIDDTLILTKDAALIVNVKNRTVVTAMDRNSLNGNVFTNIDGAVII